MNVRVNVFGGVWCVCEYECVSVCVWVVNPDPEVRSNGNVIRKIRVRFRLA